MERLIYSSKFSPKPSTHHLPQLGRTDAARIRLPAESLRVTSLFGKHDDPSRRSSLSAIPNRVLYKQSTKCSSASSSPPVDLQNGSKPARHLVEKIVGRSFVPRKVRSFMQLDVVFCFVLRFFVSVLLVEYSDWWVTLLFADFVLG